MELFILPEDINSTKDSFEYSYDNGLTLPERLIDTLKYSSKPFIRDRIVYVDKDYVAYASLYIERIPVKKKYKVVIDNIRRKEYFNEPLSDNEKKDLDKALNGIQYTAEKIKYIKSCGGEIKDGSLTGKFI